MSKSKEQYFTTITLVQAPGIPEAERKALESHWKKAELDPNYSVVLNYECRADVIYIHPGSKLLVQAPNLPVKEIAKLRQTISEARKAKRQADRVVVINYECRIDAV